MNGAPALSPNRPNSRIGYGGCPAAASWFGPSVATTCTRFVGPATCASESSRYCNVRVATRIATGVGERRRLRAPTRIGFADLQRANAERARLVLQECGEQHAALQHDHVLAPA